MTQEPIRLACSECDRDDFDGIDELPIDWTDITEVQSLKESLREVALDDQSRSPLDWHTHVGTCAECQPKGSKS